MDNISELTPPYAKYPAKDLTPKLWAELLTECNVLNVDYIIPTKYIRDESDMIAIIREMARFPISKSPFDTNITDRFTYEQIVEYTKDYNQKDVILKKIHRSIKYRLLKNMTTDEMIAYIKTCDVIPSHIPTKHKIPIIWNTIWDRDPNHIAGTLDRFRWITPYMLDNLHYTNRMQVLSNIELIPAESISLDILRQYYKYCPTQRLYNHPLMTAEMILPLLRDYPHSCSKLPLQVQIDIHYSLGGITISDEAKKIIAINARQKSARSIFFDQIM